MSKDIELEHQTDINPGVITDGLRDAGEVFDDGTLNFIKNSLGKITIKVTETGDPEITVLSDN